MIEGKHYKLIPVDVENDQAWEIRILTGIFTETVIRFGNIEADGRTHSIKFNFEITSTTDEDLTIDDEDLQEVVGEILGSVLENHFESGHMVLDDK